MRDLERTECIQGEQRDVDGSFSLLGVHPFRYVRAMRISLFRSSVPAWTSVAALFVFASSLGSCVRGAHEETERASQSVVYGEDDRQDVYAHPDMALRELTRRSIVALVPAMNVDTSDPARVVLSGDPLGMSMNLCPGERFANDPTASSCSGTLIDDNLVLTAGHCFEGMTADERRTSCRGQRFVFGYYYDAANVLHPIVREDVFSCDDLVVWVNGRRGELNLDYAIVRLDRAAAPRFTPVTVRRAPAALAASAPLAVIGFGSGIPAKIDTGGRVVDPRANMLDYFEANTDTFQGNSGSGVFDPTSRDLVGILVRGATDYVMRGTCQVANRCALMPDPANMACAGESVNYPHHAITELCASAMSARLCSGAQPDGGTPPGDSGTAMEAGAPPADAGTTNNDATSPAQDAAPPASTTQGGGCSCAVDTASSRPPFGALLGALALARGLMRRRRSTNAR